MKNLKSTKEIAKHLRMHGWGDFSLRAIATLLSNHGRKKVWKHFYKTPDAIDCCEKNIGELKELAKTFPIQSKAKKARPKVSVRQSEDDFDLPIGYYKDISKASQECLDDQEVDYSRYNYFHRNESLKDVVDTYGNALIESFVHQTIEKTEEDVKTNNDLVKSCFVDLETAIPSFLNLCSKFKHIKVNLWDIGTDDVKTINDLVELDGYDCIGPRLDFSTKELCVVNRNEYNIEIANIEKRLMISVFGSPEYGVKYSTFWRDDNILDEECLYDYYIELKDVDDQIEDAIKSLGLKESFVHQTIEQTEEETKETPLPFENVKQIFTKCALEHFNYSEEYLAKDDIEGWQDETLILDLYGNDNPEASCQIRLYLQLREQTDGGCYFCDLFVEFRYQGDYDYNGPSVEEWFSVDIPAQAVRMTNLQRILKVFNQILQSQGSFKWMENPSICLDKMGIVHLLTKESKKLYDYYDSKDWDTRRFSDDYDNGFEDDWDEDDEEETFS